MSNKNTDQPNESLLTFPCDFTIKVFGQNNQDFENAVLMIINKHAPNLSGRTIQSRTSSNSKYRALSVTLHVESRQQLDNIYQDLSSSPQVLMAI